MSKSKRKQNKNNPKNNPAGFLWQQIFKPLLQFIGNITGKLSQGAVKKLKRFVLDELRAIKRRQKGQPRRMLSQGGFVLPTVTMVMLVVILLTIAISLRSFDRAQDARNVRVNQAVLSAATPALDRASAKLDYLLHEDPALPRETPVDTTINSFLNRDIYRFGDEERLQVSFDLPNTVNPESAGSIDADGDDADGDDTGDFGDDEQVTTAWRFPVDTDNNGKYDSFTVYGIFFRRPQDRARQPLDARTPPMADLEISSRQECRAAGASGVADGSGWDRLEGNLKKSFFTYTATVPITDTSELTFGNETGADDYEEFKGTTGVSALEYQQDRSRIPLTNNAVVYEDDLEIAPGPAFRLNGRIFTNSNFIVTAQGNPFALYQVSGNDSCFYEAENAKIIVGGNVVNGTLEDDVREAVTVHLHGPNPESGAPEISQSAGVQSVTNSTTAVQVAYNTDAYAQRLNLLVEAQMDESDDPEQVDDVVAEGEDRQNAIEQYFRERLRKVPFAEVTPGASAVGSYTDSTVLQDSGDSVRPPDDWVWPTTNSISGGVDTGSAIGTNRAELDLKMLQLPARNPETLEDNEEEFLGDRLLAGNNLPEKRWISDETGFVKQVLQQYDGSAEWYAPGDTSNPTSGSLRYRKPQVVQLADVGAMKRGGFWEKEGAAMEPNKPLDAVGGLRVITGAGVYERKNSFLPPPDCANCTNSGTTVTYDDQDTSAIEAYEVVWPDTMPMSPAPDSEVFDNENNTWDELDRAEWSVLDEAPTTALTNTIDPNTNKYAKGDLRMRATVLYHYAVDPIDGGTDTAQDPIACISSYYDPTDTNTVRNLAGLEDVSGWDAPDVLAGWTAATYRPPASPPAPAYPKSNNGIVYPPPSTARPTTATSNANLVAQANMVFPDGRFVNEPLRKALLNVGVPDKYSLADEAAIDAALCSLDILDGTISPISPTETPTSGITIPHGTIKEISLLDPRQVKAIEKDNDDTADVDETFTLDGNGDLKADDYNLPLEERQPLEIRVTQLDLDRMRQIEVPFAAGVVGPQNKNGNEFLLPYSGIVYASRDDALPDLSDISDPENPDQLLSATDLKLDPTRRPNGIMLINGEDIGRIPAFDAPLEIEEVAQEKGLTLVSNEPVYIQGDFNKHQDSSGNPLEEFTTTLESDWGNFYDRTALDDPDTINPDFACKAGDTRVTSGGCAGDLWRPVNVLADAVVLLHENFRPGVRNEGDFDLRNNAGNGVVVGYDAEDNPITAKQARRFNGFMTNSFVTNGLSSRYVFNMNGNNTTASPTQNEDPNDNSYRNSPSGDLPIDSSYFNNFVTPIQRRISFPEYVMEMCTKLPVSECSPDDWIVGETATDTKKASDFSYPKTITLNNIRAGTTGRFMGRTTKEDQRFARRLAFSRNDYNLLKLSEVGSTGNYTAIPIGVSGGSAIDEFRYGSGVPQSKGNSLWFRTNSNASTSGLPHCSGATDSIVAGDTGCTTNDISYDRDKPLYYLPPNFDGDINPPNRANEWDMPEFQDNNPTGDDNPSTSSDYDVKWINWPLLPKTPTIERASLPTYNLGDGDEFAICNSNGSGFVGYEIDGSTTANLCSGDENDAGSDVTTINISEFYDALADSSLFPADFTDTWNRTSDQTLDFAGESDTDDDGIYVYDIPPGLSSPTTIGPAVITLEGDSQSVFVLRVSDSLTIGNASDAVTLELEGGVDPNKIFWVVDGDLTIDDAGTKLAGNFLGKEPTSGTNIVTINNDAQILGGRFLGFNNTSGITSNEVYAMTTQAQPVLVPVLQIHHPEETTANNTTAIGSGGDNDKRDTEWMMNANSTVFNLVVGSKDVPSRPTVPSSLEPGETNGGLQNLPRFLGNWRRNDSSTSIEGSFIQLGRSEFATAPYQQIIDENNPPESAFPGDDYDLVYQSGAARGLNGYQSAPGRDWGFDVGMLSQAPDLFAQKFTVPPSDSNPDEYFREVSRDDPWIESLLCSKLETGGTKAINRPDAGEDGYYCGDYE